MRITRWGIAGLLALGALAGMLFVLAVNPARAHMHDRPDLNDWFGKLASGKGLCCSFADGVAIEDVDWDTRCEATKGVTGEAGKHCVYRVHLHGEWIVIPESAVVAEPNRYGPAVVWPYVDTTGGETKIRCFLPGAGA